MNFIAKIADILKSERFKIILGEIFGFLFLLFGTIVIPNILFYIPRLSFYSGLLIGDHNDIIEVGTALISMPPLFYVLIYSSTANYRLMYNKSHERSHISVSKLSFVLSHPIFYIKCSVFAAIYLTMPMSKLYAPLYAIMVKLDLNSYASHVRLILLAVLFILSLLAKVSAVRTWERDAKSEASKPFAFLGISVTYMLVFLMIGLAINIFVPMLISLAPIVRELFGFNITKAFLALIVLVIIMSYARAFSKRRKCLKQLYALCAGQKNRCEKIKRPYLSVLFPSSSLPFEIKTGNEIFTCKLISGRRLYTRMRINKEGYGEYVFPVKAAGITLFEIKHTIYFDFESPHRKIIIFNPSPHYIFVEEYAGNRQIDNGAQIGEYKIYNTTAFLNLIERNCLGK